MANAMSFIMNVVSQWWSVTVPGLGISVGALFFGALSLPVAIGIIYKVVRGL